MKMDENIILEIHIRYDECGLIRVTDVGLKTDLTNISGSPCFTKWQAEKLAKSYEQRGFTIVWEI